MRRLWRNQLGLEEFADIKAALARAQATFAACAQDGRVTETFEILTLSGWARALKAPKF